MFVNEGANTLDFARSIVDMYEPRKRLDVGTWGIMGIGMGFAVAAAVITGKPVIAIEGDSAFGFSRHGSRNDLPLQPAGVRGRVQQQRHLQGHRPEPERRPTWRPPCSSRTRATTMMMQAFGGVGVHATTPAELRRRWSEAITSGKPTLINAVIDETAGTESGRITSLNPATGQEEES